MAPVLQALLPGCVEGSLLSARHLGVATMMQQAPTDLSLAEDPQTHRVQGVWALGGRCLEEALMPPSCIKG